MYTRQEAVVDRLVKVPPDQGYYWMRCSPSGDWQIVKVCVAVGNKDTTKLLRVFFIGDAERISAVEFCRQWPEAEWGAMVLRLAA